MSSIRTIVKGIVSAIITLISLYQTIHNPTACWTFIIAAIVVGVLAILLFKRNKQDAIVAICSAIIMLIFSVWGVIQDNELKKNESSWISFLRSRPEDSFLELKRKADSGDSPSQIKVSSEYAHRVDYSNALKYAQKAADNGSAEAFAQVALYQIYGMGCIADIQQGVSNMINAQRIDNYRFDSILEELSERGIVLSETDSMRLRHSDQVRERLKEIDNLIISTYNEKGNASTIMLIQSLAEEINQYSLSGYIPATEILFFGEMLKNPNGSPELRRLATQLYKANQIPTQPFERGYFLQLVRDDEDYYDSKKYQQYIKDNNYCFVGMIEAFHDNIPSFDYGKYSNKFLIEEYELFRAQYEWFLSLKEKRIPNKGLAFSLVPENYIIDVYIAEELLRSNILGIQQRMLCPEQGISETEDWLCGYRFELSLETRGIIMN